MKNKKAQIIDMEVLASPGFIILVAMAVGATLIGWSMGPKMGFETRFPIWQLIVIIMAELIASYVIVLRGS